VCRGRIQPCHRNVFHIPLKPWFDPFEKSRPKGIPQDYHQDTRKKQAICGKPHVNSSNWAVFHDYGEQVDMGGGVPAVQRHQVGEFPGDIELPVVPRRQVDQPAEPRSVVVDPDGVPATSIPTGRASIPGSPWPISSGGSFIGAADINDAATSVA
jgi:hypothetical protein